MQGKKNCKPSFIWCCLQFCSSNLWLKHTSKRMYHPLDITQELLWLLEFCVLTHYLKLRIMKKIRIFYKTYSLVLVCSLIWFCRVSYFRQDTTCVERSSSVILRRSWNLVSLVPWSALLFTQHLFMASKQLDYYGSGTIQNKSILILLWTCFKYWVYAHCCAQVM